ncbi:TC1DA protein, partial [Donacobius atricapilla]|nr:TC1DA protein [Donacobius atricapilla]
PAGPGRRFPAAAVDAILRDALGSALRERRYEPGPCREAARDIAEAVRARVKALAVPRYKIVVVAHVGQLAGQSLQVGSRCLWDPQSDTFSSYVFKNASLFAVATVYGVYVE